MNTAVHSENIQQQTTEAALNECGDFLGELFHPAFKEVAYWTREKVRPYIPTDVEVTSYAIIG